MERLAEETGLRFDLYERVRLPEDLPAIGDLEQVELLPCVQEGDGRDGPQLKGHLQLTAVYAPEGDGAAQRTFTHRIPVDISLPARSAAEGGDIRVEIEQFDIELVSARSLDVTGVLALSGLMRSEGEERRDAAGEEEIVAVHQAKKKPDSDQVQVVAGDGIAGGAPFPVIPPAPSASGEPADPPDRPGPKQAGPPNQEPASGDGWNAVPAGAWPEPDKGKPDETDLDADWPYPAEPASAVPQEGESLDAEDWLEDEMDFSENRDRAEGGDPAVTEPKVAFKPLEEPHDEGGESAETTQSAGTRNNELEWQKLFLARGEEQPFRKLRLCIVQKEETIDTIAERYQLNPREIALYNRLSDSGLEEGQILYIPPS